MGPSLIILIITVVIFLLCRELMCWYWKINRSISNQERIIELLEILTKQGQISVASTLKDNAKTSDDTTLGGFSIGDLVVNKEGKQMRIKEIQDGKYACYTHGGTHFEGLFDEVEISLFENK